MIDSIFLLSRNPLEEALKLEKFLKLPKYFTEANFSFRKKRHGSMKTFPCFKNATYEFCMKNDKGREHPKIQASTEIYLQNLFRPMVDKLFQMTGIRLDISA